MVLKGKSTQYKIGEVEIEISYEDLADQLSRQGYLLVENLPKDIEGYNE